MHAVDACLDLDQIEWLADEILRAGLQCPQLMARLSGDDEYRKVAGGFYFLQAFQHLKAIHAGHFQIEQNQIVEVRWK